MQSNCIMLRERGNEHYNLNDYNEAIIHYEMGELKLKHFF